MSDCMSARSLQLVLFDPLIPSYCPQPRAETPRKRFYVMGIGRVLGASQLLNDMTLQKAWDPIKSTHWYHESWDVPVEEVWDNELWVFLISSFSAPFYLMKTKYIYIYTVLRSQMISSITYWCLDVSFVPPLNSEAPYMSGILSTRNIWQKP